MKITISPEVFIKLILIENAVGNREFSGYGFIDIREGNDFFVYDIELLDVGTTGYTEFSSKQILEVLKREDSHKMKLWYHRHPLGNGKPGPHNWSGTDNNTCVNEPLGCPDPVKVDWALAMVLTPGGWVGRVDQFKDGKHKTTHIPVEFGFDFSVFEKAKELLAAQEDNEIYEEEISDIGFVEDDEDAFDVAHQDIDEAMQVVSYANYQLMEGFTKEAIDSTAWAHDIGQFYKNNPYVGHKAKKLLNKAFDMINKLRKEGLLG